MTVPLVLPVMLRAGVSEPIAYTSTGHPTALVANVQIQLPWPVRLSMLGNAITPCCTPALEYTNTVLASLVRNRAPSKNQELNWPENAALTDEFPPGTETVSITD